MPELPEVQTVVDSLLEHLPGRKIHRARLLRRDIVRPAGLDLPARLKDRRIELILRRGKRIIFQLDDANRFFIHLGMTGQLTVEPCGKPPRPHTHLAIEVRHEGTEARRHEGAPTRPSVPSCLRASVPSLSLHFRDPRRFGGIWWVGTGAAPDQGLGPEPLTLRPAQLLRLLSRTRRPIKNALLDQRLIAGLGNIYADEALFAAAVHPLAPADQLSRDQVARLNRAIKTTLRRAIRHKGSSLRDYVDGNGQSGAFQNLHRVYAREDHPCRACRAPIQRIVLAGRSTHFCPNCQSP